MHSPLTHQAKQLQMKNQTMMISATGTLLAALFTTALLPSLLVQYVYADQQLLTTPPLLNYIPIVSFVLGMGYFLLAVIGNVLRSRRISYLEKRALLEGEDECCHGHSMEKVESLAEALVNESMTEKKSTASKSSRKSAAKKSSSKKSTSKNKNSKKSSNSKK